MRMTLPSTTVYGKLYANAKKLETVYCPNPFRFATCFSFCGKRIDQMNYIIPKGVFFRYYGLPSNESATVVYNTISQSVVLLEGDSAEVGKRILESGGKTDSALDYILKNGTF